MRRLALTLLGISALISTITPAQAGPPGTSMGIICLMFAVEDPSAEPGTYSGIMLGGPIVLTGENATTPETGTLTCRIQVNQSTHTGAGPSVAQFGKGLFATAPTQVTYTAGDADNVYLCSEFTDANDGMTYYWNQRLFQWSSDPNTRCTLALGSGVPSEDERLIDSIICPVLARVFPPEGDVVLPVIGGVVDCPPYGNSSESVVLAPFHFAVEFNLIGPVQRGGVG